MNATITGTVLATLLACSTALAGAPPRWTSEQTRYHQRDSWDRGQHGRYDERRDFARERFRGGYYRAPRGYHDHRWRRGERLPRTYYARPYVVYRYRGYHLYDPPRGYCWVRVHNDVLLTAIATGLVLDAVYDLYE